MMFFSDKMVIFKLKEGLLQGTCTLSKVTRVSVKRKFRSHNSTNEGVKRLPST